MSRKRWTDTYVRERFSARVREQLRAEGKDPEIKPTYEWLRQHGYSGIQGYAARNNSTVDEILINVCGFRKAEHKPLPVNHVETKKLIEQWLSDEDIEFSRWNDVSVSNARSHLRKLLQISRNELGSTNLLRPARAPPGKNVRLTLDLMRGLNNNLESEGARYNYASTLSDFYEYLTMIGEADSNPLEMVLPRMGWTYSRSGPGEILKPAQVRQCWDSTENLVEQIIVLTIAGAGARTGDLQIINAVEDIRLELADPVIIYGENRKNGPGVVPLLAGHQYYEAYIEQLEENGYEVLLPSDQSQDGTRSGKWIRDTVEDIVDRAEVRLPDGSKPTPKHFRRFWFNEYLSAYEAYISIVERVASDQGSVSAAIVDKHYLANHRSRDHFRRFAESHFESAFPADIMLSYEEIIEAREDNSKENQQSTLRDFSAY